MSTSLTGDRSQQQQRLSIERLTRQYSSGQNHKREGADVIEGLTQPQKSLPPHYFYDERGSLLFEQICELPEYYPTRTEAAILTQQATTIARQTGACELVELGSGSSTKTRLLLDAHRQLGQALRYKPIDVSASILQESAQQLLADYPTLQVHGLVSTYETALQQLGPSPLGKRTVLFLGSTLGNFSQSECDRFFSQLQAALNRGDYFLLGIDLQKPKEVLEAAYNDSQGVTAAFNLNMLRHLNWRFSGNFNLDLFEHGAFYNESRSRIEMHLVSQSAQQVRLNGLNLIVEFQAGETILTEISRKFNWQQMQDYLMTKGLKTVDGWVDDQYPFGVLLSRCATGKG
ncbi:MAG: L-histidine N(alpha)-methyltransferase [Cyanophyceae cyanobacterium]